LVVGKAYDFTSEDLNIAHDTISWSDRLQYLVVHFKSGRTLLVDNETVIRNFYAVANAIYSHAKFATEVMVLFLIEMFCLLWPPYVIGQATIFLPCGFCLSIFIFFLA